MEKRENIEGMEKLETTEGMKKLDTTGGMEKREATEGMGEERPTFSRWAAMSEDVESPSFGPLSHTDLPSSTISLGPSSVRPGNQNLSAFNRETPASRTPTTNLNYQQQHSSMRMNRHHYNDTASLVVIISRVNNAIEPEEFGKWLTCDRRNVQIQNRWLSGRDYSYRVLAVDRQEYDRLLHLDGEKPPFQKHPVVVKPDSQRGTSTGYVNHYNNNFPRSSGGLNYGGISHFDSKPGSFYPQNRRLNDYSGSQSQTSSKKGRNDSSHSNKVLDFSDVRRLTPAFQPPDNRVFHRQTTTVPITSNTPSVQTESPSASTGSPVLAESANRLRANLKRPSTTRETDSSLPPRNPNIFGDAKPIDDKVSSGQRSDAGSNVKNSSSHRPEGMTGGMESTGTSAKVSPPRAMVVGDSASSAAPLSFSGGSRPSDGHVYTYGGNHKMNKQLSSTGGYFVERTGGIERQKKADHDLPPELAARVTMGGTVKETTNAAVTGMIEKAVKISPYGDARPVDIRYDDGISRQQWTTGSGVIAADSHPPSTYETTAATTKQQTAASSSTGRSEKTIDSAVLSSPFRHSNNKGDFSDNQQSPITAEISLPSSSNAESSRLSLNNRNFHLHEPADRVSTTNLTNSAEIRIPASFSSDTNRDNPSNSSQPKLSKQISVTRVQAVSNASSISDNSANVNSYSADLSQLNSLQRHTNPEDHQTIPNDGVILPKSNNELKPAVADSTEKRAALHDNTTENNSYFFVKPDVKEGQNVWEVFSAERAKREAVEKSSDNMLEDMSSGVKSVQDASQDVLDKVEEKHQSSAISSGSADTSREAEQQQQLVSGDSEQQRLVTTEGRNKPRRMEHNNGREVGTRHRRGNYRGIRDSQPRNLKDSVGNSYTGKPHYNKSVERSTNAGISKEGGSSNRRSQNWGNQRNSSSHNQQTFDGPNSSSQHQRRTEHQRGDQPIVKDDEQEASSFLKKFEANDGAYGGGERCRTNMERNADGITASANFEPTRSARGDNSDNSLAGQSRRNMNDSRKSEGRSDYSESQPHRPRGNRNTAAASSSPSTQRTNTYNAALRSDGNEPRFPSYKTNSNRYQKKDTSSIKLSPQSSYNTSNSYRNDTLRGAQSRQKPEQPSQIVISNRYDVLSESKR